MQTQEHNEKTKDDMISVIVPIYNGAAFLHPTVECVINQSYKNFELILVDDGSTDNTPAMCDEYAKNDERIKVIHQNNKGMSGARDEGYKLSCGSYIMFIDGDDILPHNMFEIFMNLIDDADFICSNIKDFTCQAELSKIMIEKPISTEIIISNNERRLFERNEYGGIISTIAGMLISRSFFEKMKSTLYDAKNIFPQNYLNDCFAAPRFVCSANKIVLINNAMYFHRLCENSDSLLIKPNALHYELIEVVKKNVEYSKSVNNKAFFDSFLQTYYLVILKLWYQTYTSEDDKDKRERYIRKVDNYYKEYYDELKKLKCFCLKDRLIKLSVMLYKIHPLFWKLCVGNVRYGIMYKKMKKDKSSTGKVV